MVHSDYLDLTYGNLSGSVTGQMYPSACQGFGLGAYSAEKLAEAKAAGYTDTELASPTGNAYYGYNAGLYEAGNGTVGSDSLGEEMNGTAQYITVVVDYDSCISFYRNGALAYEYYSEKARQAAGFLCVSAYDRGEGDEGKMTAFAGACGNVDNVIVGKALSANEALALYNDQMGASKTEADAIIGSADDKVKARADQFAKDDAVAAYSKAVKAAAKKVDTSKGILTLGDTKYKTTWWTEFAGVTPTYGADGKSFDVTVKGYLFNDQASGSNWHSIATIVNSSAGVEYTERMDNYGWVDATLNSATSTGECTWNWDTFIDDVHGAEITINIKYDGTTVEINYTAIPLLKGESYTKTSTGTLSDGSTHTGTYTVTPAESYTQKYLVTNLSATDGVFPSFCVEASYFVFTSVEGGTLA